MKIRCLFTTSIVIIISTIVVVFSVGCSSTAKTPTPTAAPAQSPADFYSANVVTLVCTGGAGGGTDFAARVFASYWQTVVEGGLVKVDNMSEAGGIVGTNFGYAAKPDGLTITVVDGGGYLGSSIFGAAGVTWDATKFIPIGVFGNAPSVLLASAKSTYTEVNNLKNASDVTFAAYSPPDEASISASLIASVFDMQNARLVSGYQSTEDASLALARGEVMLAVDSAATSRSRIDKGFAKPQPLLIVDVKRSNWFPDIPTIMEVTKLTAEQQKKLDILTAIQSSKVLLVPPSTPQDRVDFLRESFMKVMADKGFLRQAQLRWAVWEEPVSGTDFMKIVQSVSKISKEDVDKIEAEVKSMIRL